MLALAALAFQHEPTRSLLTERDPPFLPFVLTSLNHPSYGVRAAACQVARALSRTAAILRTSLIDSGVGEEVIKTLKKEVAANGNAHNARPYDPNVEGSAENVEDEDEEQKFTVEIAALATICNLITDFSPLRTVSA